MTDKSDTNISALPHSSWQGSLDGLCGVYAVINALALLPTRAHLRRADHQNLFAALCTAIAPPGHPAPLGQLLTEGLGFRTVAKLVDVASAYMTRSHGLAVQRRVAFKKNPESLSLFWEVLESHFEKNGPGSIILGTSGMHDHWTTVSNIYPRRITLADSDGLSHFNRSRCTVADPSRIRPHSLWGTQTLLLTIQSANGEGMP